MLSIVTISNFYRKTELQYDNLVETQLYWVSSRYYSPELCRWISPDSIEYSDLSSINGLNLYAYCGNDPINNYDLTGHFAISALIIGAIIGATIGFGGTVLADYVDDGNEGDSSSIRTQKNDVRKICIRTWIYYL